MRTSTSCAYDFGSATWITQRGTTTEDRDYSLQQVLEELSDGHEVEISQKTYEVHQRGRPSPGQQVWLSDEVSGYTERVDCVLPCMKA